MDEKEEVVALLQFLEAVRLRSCKEYKKSFTRCIEKKNHRFETCYMKDFEKFMACSVKILN
jgi:hypothetical protein